MSKVTIEGVDGTFIEHSTLPKVVVSDDPRCIEIEKQAYYIEEIRSDGDRAYFESRIKQYLALLRWVDANPEPIIDQEQVAEFVDAFEDAGANFTSAEFNAEALVKAGYRIVKSDD